MLKMFRFTRSSWAMGPGGALQVGYARCMPLGVPYAVLDQVHTSQGATQAMQGRT